MGLEPQETFAIPNAVGAAPSPCQFFRPDVAPSGLAFVVHGRGGAVAQPHIQALVAAYLARGWSVAAPDLPHSSAHPELGPAEDVTLDNHAQAAAVVLEGVRSRVSAASRIALCGHSLGAYAVALGAVDVSGLHHLLAVSPVVSGQALLDARAALGPAALEEVARDAPRMYATMAGANAAVPALQQCEAAVAVVTGASDGLTPPAAAKRYFNAARHPAFYAVLPGQHHCPTGPGLDRALAAAFDAVEA